VADANRLLVIAAVVGLSLLVAAGIARVVELRVGGSELAQSGGSSSETVQFADPQLEGVVREILGSAGAPFVAVHLARIKQISARGRGIEDLRGLEYCTGLERLDLSDNKILSIGALSQLTELRTLYLANNLIRDLQPLADLEWLADLDLSGNRLEEVSPLAGLGSMAHLNLSRNEIRDVGALWRIRALFTLDLSENSIESVSGIPQVQPCAGPGSRVWIPARGKYVEISCANPTIDLSDNLIQDISPLLGWIDQAFAGHAVDLSGDPLDLADGSPTREIIRELESRGIRVCR